MPIDWANTQCCQPSSQKGTLLHSIITQALCSGHCVEEDVLHCSALPPVGRRHAAWSKRHKGTGLLGRPASRMDSTQVIMCLFIKHLVDRYRSWAVPALTCVLASWILQRPKRAQGPPTMLTGPGCYRQDDDCVVASI